MSKITCLDNKGNPHTFDELEFTDRKAAYGIYLKNSAVLMVRDTLSNYWEFPGGGLDNDESIEEALAREFMEETGLRIKTSLKLVNQFIEYFFDLNGNEPWKTERNFYLVEEVFGELRVNGNNDDVSEVKMIELSTIDTLQIKSNIIKVLQLVI